MAIALDANMLILLFDGQASAPIDPVTCQPVTYCQERLIHFVELHSRTKGARIIIPTPALGEFLVKVDPAKVGDYLSRLQRIRGCTVAPFSIRATVEFAEMQRIVIGEQPRRKQKAETESRAKAKFDKQIIAIARSEGVATIYSDDLGLGRFAARFGITRIGVADLVLPPKSRQGEFALEPLEPDRPEPDELG